MISSSRSSERTPNMTAAGERSRLDSLRGGERKLSQMSQAHMQSEVSTSATHSRMRNALEHPEVRGADDFQGLAALLYPQKMIRLSELLEIMSKSKSWVYGKLDKNSPYYDPDFPRPVQLSDTGSSVAWVLGEVTTYIQKRMDIRSSRGSQH